MYGWTLYWFSSTNPQTCDSFTTMAKHSVAFMQVLWCWHTALYSLNVESFVMALPSLVKCPSFHLAKGPIVNPQQGSKLSKFSTAQREMSLHLISPRTWEANLHKSPNYKYVFYFGCWVHSQSMCAAHVQWVCIQGTLAKEKEYMKKWHNPARNDIMFYWI